MRRLKVLMIGAHPDDPDGCGGGAAIRYVSHGHEVRFLSVSDGSAGHQSMARAPLAARRRKEADAAAELIGITYDVWDIPDGEVEANLENRRRMVRYIREYAPDLVITHRVCDYHADHRNVALLVQDASYLLTVPNFCPDTPIMPKMPVIAFFADSFTNPPFRADVVVPIDDVVDRKYAVLRCHESQYFEWLPFNNGTLDTVPEGDEARAEWFRSPRVPRDRALVETELAIGTTQSSYSEYRMARLAVLYRDVLRAQCGEAADRVIFAEAYEISEYGRQPKGEELAMLFPL